MKLCEICKETPAMKGKDLCAVCLENMDEFGHSPEGVVMSVLKAILLAAEEGGFTVKRTDAVGHEILEAIRNGEGMLCECPRDHRLTTNDICFKVIRCIDEIVDDFYDFHDQVDQE